MSLGQQYYTTCDTRVETKTDWGNQKTEVQQSMVQSSIPNLYQQNMCLSRFRAPSYQILNQFGLN